MPYKERLRALVSKGYFPRELPPVFTTRDFGHHVSDILDEWKIKKVFTQKTAGNIPKSKKKKSRAYTYVVDHAEIEIISKPKRGYERRNIHITHPIPQALLSYELASNWKAVQKWLSRQTYSLDEIRVSNNFERSIKGINFQIHRAKKAYLEATSDWLVKTDISRFYPTIYTHSISWAAYGKERVKENLKLYSGSFADRLDILVRSCNRNQTIGIPIGPETSRIIAEIISSRIDSNFQNKMPDIPRQRVDRLQDDWFIGVNTLEKAETVLSTITVVYRDYGLEINGNKTSINHIIASSGTPWVSEIGAFLSHRPGPIRAARLKELLSLSLRLQSEFPNEPVVNYVLSIVEGQQITSGDIEILESFLLKAAVISPISMNHICRIILNLQHKTEKVSRRRVGERFVVLAERNLEKGNIYEVIWLVYTLRGLKISLRSKMISELIEITSSSALALILLDMKSKGLCLSSLPTAEWIGRITKERVKSDWIWLLAYEAIRHGWLPDPSNVMAEPFFRAMASRNVVFYDPKRNVPSSTKIVRMRSRSRRKQFNEMQKIIHLLRGFEFLEY
jgi:hypothetical protein